MKSFLHYTVRMITNQPFFQRNKVVIISLAAGTNIMTDQLFYSLLKNLVL